MPVLVVYLPTGIVSIHLCFCILLFSFFLYIPKKNLCDICVKYVVFVAADVCAHVENLRH